MKIKSNIRAGAGAKSKSINNTVASFVLTASRCTGV